MGSMPDIRRVILVVLDGLRADLIRQGELPNAARLCERGAWTAEGETVLPSVTSAAMTSLFTGVSPSDHGVGRSGFRIPDSPSQILPMTRLLAGSLYPSSIFLRNIPLHYRWMASQLKRLAHVEGFCPRGDSAAEILTSASSTIHSQSTGLIFMHWPDADEAGHRDGWHSEGYLQAARDLDRSVGDLMGLVSESARSGTLMVFCADHGGGGVDPRDHDSTHPQDTSIPIILSGDAVRPAPLVDAKLVDIPATILWSLGIEVPSHYRGRPLREAFGPVAAAA